MDIGNKELENGNDSCVPFLFSSLLADKGPGEFSSSEISHKPTAVDKLALTFLKYLFRLLPLFAGSISRQLDVGYGPRGPGRTLRVFGLDNGANRRIDSTSRASRSSLYSKGSSQKWPNDTLNRNDEGVEELIPHCEPSLRPSRIAQLSAWSNPNGKCCSFTSFLSFASH